MSGLLVLERRGGASLPVDPSVPLIDFIPESCDPKSLVLEPLLLLLLVLALVLDDGVLCRILERRASEYSGWSVEEKRESHKGVIRMSKEQSTYKCLAGQVELLKM
jgi:hypothetical protein